jgi:ATP/maltotriose-dependent transcriptional regulator MalT
LEQAGEELAAARWHRRAAEWIGRSDVAQAIRHWQRVLALTAELPESEERTGLRLAAELPDVLAGDLNLGLDLAGFSLLAFSWQTRAEFFAYRGRFDDARTCQREAERLARAGDVGETLTWIRQNPALIGSMAGERDERVLQELRRSAFEGLELAEHIGSSFSRVCGHMYVGLAQALNGDWDDAVRACETALQISNEHQTGLDLESEILYHLAEAHLGAGDLRAAQAAAEQGIRRAQERGQLYFEALNHLTRARVLRRARGADARDEIEGSLDRALALVEETNARAIEPQILEERARLANLLGDAATCERGLWDAHRLYTEIGATGHAERRAEELGL